MTKRTEALKSTEWYQKRLDSLLKEQSKREIEIKAVRGLLQKTIEHNVDFFNRRYGTELRVESATETTSPTGKTKSGGRRRRTVYKTGIKYRHPSDHSKGWSGLGPRPKWFQEALDSGESLASLAVSE